MSTQAPTALQLDALREVANVGCGNAANALSRLVGGRSVRIDVPRVIICERDGVETLIGGADAALVSGGLGLSGGLEGQMLLVLPEADAHRLCGLLLGTPNAGPLSNDERSAVGEVANIVASACLTAISDLSGLRMLPTPPKVLQGPAREVLDALFNGATGPAVVLEARFATQAAPPFSGQLLLVPEPKSLAQLLAKLGV